jgi:hypothetical protein
VEWELSEKALKHFGFILLSSLPRLVFFCLFLFHAFDALVENEDNLSEEYLD